MIVAIGIKHISEPIPELPAGMDIFQPIINICLSKDPEHRYKTAGEFLKALEQISEADIDFLDAKSAASKKLGKNHQAKTISTNSNPILAADQIKNKKQTTIKAPVKNITANDFAYEITDSDDYKRLGRRKRLLVWFVILSLLAGVGYVKQDLILEFWQSYITPKIEQYFNQTNDQANTRDKMTNEQNLTEQQPDEIPARAGNPVQTKNTALPGDFALAPETNIETVKELSLSNRAVLQDNPTDVHAIKQLNKITRWYIVRASTAIENLDYTTARKLITQANSTLPAEYRSKKILQLDNQILRHESILGHMQRAAEYIKQGSLTVPADKNAVAELRAVIAIDPAYSLAKNELSKIAQHYFAEAKLHQANEKPHEALASVELGLGIDQRHIELLELKQTLQLKIQLQEKLMSILIQAEAQFQAGKVMLPKDGSAISLYKQVLREQKNNKSAHAGLLKAEDYVIKQIQTAIWKKKFKQAETILKAALSEFPNSARLDQVHKKFITAKSANAARITHLLISDQSFTTLLIEQPRLTVTPTLHLGFSYTNLSKDTTTLTLKLESVTENQILIEKKLLVSETTGDQIIALRHPLATFITGQYRVTISLEGKSLITRSFDIRANLPAAKQ